MGFVWSGLSGLVCLVWFVWSGLVWFWFVQFLVKIKKERACVEARVYHIYHIYHIYII
jgi:hypothetical protein